MRPAPRHAAIALAISALLACATAATRSDTLQEGYNGYAGTRDAELRDPSRNWWGGPVDSLLEVSEY